MNTRTTKLPIAAVLGGFVLIAGCSKQDFARPVGRYGDVIDSGSAYLEDDSEADALRRAERLSRVLLAWEEQRSGVEKDYFVGNDDALSIGILALDQPGEVTTLERTITKAGRISLPLIGDVEVAGRSVRDLEHEIAARYDGKYLKDPQITVEVSEYRSQPVMITGMIATPGVYHLRHNQSSVLEILSQAGGLAAEHGQELQVFRRRQAPEEKPDGDLPSSPAESAQDVKETSGSQERPVASEEAPEEPESSEKPEAEAVAQAIKTPEPTPKKDLPAVEPIPAEPAASSEDAMEPAADDAEEEGESLDLDDEDEPTERKRGFFARLFGGGDEETEVADADDDSEDGVAEEGGADPDIDMDSSEEQVAAAAQAADEDAAVAEPESDEADEDIGLASMGLETETIVVDLKELLQDGDVRQNVPIYGGDIISIPASEPEFVYVLGYVQQPGPVDLRGKKEISAIHAVSVVGGLAMAGRAENSTLIRNTRRGRQVLKVDLTKVVRGTKPPVYMEAGDTLIVGSSIFAKVMEVVRPSVSAGASLSPIP